MSIDQEISKILKDYSILVDRAIERYIPRKFSVDDLVRLLGKPRYRYEVDSLTKAISEPFWDLMDRGGKRWRPALMMIVYETLGGKAEDIVDISIIPEVIHNGTLVVDDVEDNGDFRRGKECIHRIYGVDIAINMGNTMYYLPLLVLFNRDDISQEKLVKIVRCYIEEMLKLSLGQAMDIAWHRGLVENIDEEQYMQMCSFKTGSLTRLSVKIAGILADADAKIMDALEEFADALSIAFQIQDDILNLTGDISKYGKEIGGDIKEGKRTLMVIYAMKKLPKKDAERLKEILSMHTSDQRLIDEAISLIKKSGAIEYAKTVSSELVKKAWEKLNKVIPQSPAKEKLRMLAEFLIYREF